MIKIEFVISRRYGGYGISKEAVLYCREKGAPWAQGEWRDFMGGFYPCKGTLPEESRFCPHLINFIREFGSEKASGQHADLVIESITLSISDLIREHDGYERLNDE